MFFDSRKYEKTFFEKIFFIKFENLLNDYIVNEQVKRIFLFLFESFFCMELVRLCDEFYTLSKLFSFTGVDYFVGLNEYSKSFSLLCDFSNPLLMEVMEGFVFFLNGGMESIYNTLGLFIIVCSFSLNYQYSKELILMYLFAILTFAFVFIVLGEESVCLFCKYIILCFMVINAMVTVSTISIKKREDISILYTFLLLLFFLILSLVALHTVVDPVFEGPLRVAIFFSLILYVAYLFGSFFDYNK